MESTLQKPALAAASPTRKATVLAYWIVTGLFCLLMSFTAYNELASAQVVAEFARLGFPSHAFQVELSAAKVLGVLALLLPFVPARLKEWAYAGFAINLVSALIAHFSLGDSPWAWGWAAGIGVLCGLSYFFWVRLQVTGKQTAAKISNRGA
jgi:DoxX-like family